MNQKTLLDKAYDPTTLEKECYAAWEKAGSFKPSGEGQPYCIMIPPPNVTGSLHMGHAFQQTLMDILIRYHRMQGRNTLWQVGTDHSGIATQMVVERQLSTEGHSRHDLGREEFIQRVWQWKAESGNNITQQLRRIGASVDWSSERFTLDEGLSKAVLEVFIRLYDEGLIYRGKRLVNWDPVLKTAVSDLEVELEEMEGSLWYIRYPLADGKGHIIVATTRPETMLGDVAVAVHPTDERYISLIGKQIRLPIADRLLPIIGDAMVDPTFGTGAVKITPGHDFNDYALGQRHQLPLINIFTIDATLNDQVPKPYQGLDRFIARKKVIEDLTKAELLEKIEPHTLQIPKGDRSNAILEPLLTDQWFVKVETLAKPAIKAVEEGKIRFIPENWSKTYFEWMLNIQDWCISRQLWWGHRIPAWYDNQGNIYVARNEAEVRSKYHIPQHVSLKQDNDVLDTWFSSALWPFSTLGWPENTQKLQTFYPTQVLVTGFDIIFFWVARMVMFGLKFTGLIPFHEVYIHGLIQDQDGQKMSKTKGNVLDPIDLIDGIDLEALIKKRTTGLMQPQLANRIEKNTRTQFPKGIPAYGTDALRFTFAAIATQGRHIRFDLARIEGYRHFCNKLWNAARYILMTTEDKIIHLNIDKQSSPIKINQWILSNWQRVKLDLKKHLSQYRFDLASQLLYEFTWNKYCDWYLELSKPILSKENISKISPEYRSETLYTLVSVFEELLRTLHPFIPYITEIIWQRIAPIANKTGNTIMLESYPECIETEFNEEAEEEINWLQAVILGLRNIRGEMNLSPAKLVPVLFIGTNKDEKRIEAYKFLLQFLAKVNSIEPLSSQKRPLAATALVGNLEILIPMEGLIDKNAEIARLQKEIDKLKKDLEKTNQKLSNENFIKNAPQEVVDQEQVRAKALESSIQKFQSRLKEYIQET